MQPSLEPTARSAVKYLELATLQLTVEEDKLKLLYVEVVPVPPRKKMIGEGRELKECNVELVFLPSTNSKLKSASSHDWPLKNISPESEA